MISELEAIEKRRKEKEERSVDAYESKFKQIQEISREQDLDKLVDTFIEGLSSLFFVIVIDTKKKKNNEKSFSYFS